MKTDFVTAYHCAVYIVSASLNCWKVVRFFFFFKDFIHGYIQEIADFYKLTYTKIRSKDALERAVCRTVSVILFAELSLSVIPLAESTVRILSKLILVYVIM